MKRITSILLLAVLSLSLFAQEEGGEDLSKKIQNPIASLISVPFQNNSDFGFGEYNRTKNTLNIQPVVPFGLGDKVNLIVRTIIPIISLPLDIDDSKSGLGDINMSLYFTPAKSNKVIYGVGVAMGLPTAMHANILGTGKFSVGPGIIALTQPGTWTIGALAQNTWSVAGKAERADVNLFYSQIFITKGLQKGWYLNTAPIITANWEASKGNQWTFPLGAGAGRLFKLGQLPINAQLGYYAYVVKPDGGPSSQLRAQIVLLFPK